MNRRWLGADLRAHRGALATVALIVGIGVALVVASWQVRSVIGAAVPASFAHADLPDAVLWFEAADEALRAGAARQPGVAAAELRKSLYGRITAPDGSEYPMRLYVVADPLALRVGRVHQHGGTAAPAATAGGLWIEQSARPMLGVVPGQALAVRNLAGATVPLPLAGFVHDPAVAPSTQERTIYAWADSRTAERLGIDPQPDQLLLRLVERRSSAEALAFGHRIAAWAETQQRPVLRVDAPWPQHPHALLMQTTLRLLGALALLAFACSAAWAGYTITLWLRRERRAIGILKTLGARRGRIAAHYAALALPLFSGVSILALPLGHALARWGIAALAESFNIDLPAPVVPWALPLAAALLLPVLAVAGPVWRATRAPVRDALHDEVLAPAPLGRWRARLVLPGPWRWTLALRNALRRPGRLAWIVTALGIGGALVMTTLSNHRSLMHVVDRSLAAQGHDIELLLQRPAPAAALEAIARGVPGVQRAEAWRRSVVLLDGGGAGPAATGAAHAPDAPDAADERARVALVGYPPGSPLFRLPLVAGRLPAGDAAGEVLATRALIDENPALQVGRTLLLRHGERRVPLVLTGIVEQIGPPQLYAPFASYQAVTAQGDAAGTVRVRAVPGAALQPLQRALDAAFLAAQRVPAQVLSRELLRDSLDEHVAVVGQVIRVFAAAAALLGGIGLAAASALNVIERTREIGVLRALGATPRHIAGLFVAEGALVLAAGGVLALGLSFGLTRALNRFAERGLLHVAVEPQFSWTGFAIVAGGALVLLAAVVLAVRRVLRLSARDALAYE